MIKFTKLTDYAIAILCLMAKRPEQSLPAVELAAITALPLTTVSKVMFALLKAGLLMSVRGRKGGYLLARPASTITLLDIVVAIEGQMYLVDCCDQSQNKKPCVVMKHCDAFVGLRLIDRELRGLFSTITLQKILLDGTQPTPPPVEVICRSQTLV